MDEEYAFKIKLGPILKRVISDLKTDKRVLSNCTLEEKVDQVTYWNLAALLGSAPDCENEIVRNYIL